MRGMSGLCGPDPGQRSPPAWSIVRGGCGLSHPPWLSAKTIHLHIRINIFELKYEVANDMKEAELVIKFVCTIKKICFVNYFCTYITESVSEKITCQWNTTYSEEDFIFHLRKYLYIYCDLDLIKLLPSFFLMMSVAWCILSLVDSFKIHSSMEEWFLLLVDTKNAFNKIKLVRMLCTVLHLWPYGARFVFNFHNHWSSRVLRNGN